MTSFLRRLVLFVALVTVVDPVFASQVSGNWYAYGSQDGAWTAPGESGVTIATGLLDYPTIIVRKVVTAECPDDMVCHGRIEVPLSPFDLRIYKSVTDALFDYHIAKNAHAEVWLAVVSNDGTTALVIRTKETSCLRCS